MMPEQQQRILGYFIEEAKDHLNTLEQGLLDLQATIETPDVVNEVFRAAHSVKGGAAMLGISSIQRTAHRLEDYFKILKESPVKVDRTLESMFLQVFDGLQALLQELDGPFGLTDDKAQDVMADLEPVFNQLSGHLNALVTASSARTSAPSPATNQRETAPVQPVSSQSSEDSALKLVFKSDVPGHLREMLSLFKQADTAESRAALQSCCEALERIGEQFELSSWCQLTTVACQALSNREQTYRSLAPILIKELKKAQESILAGQVTPIAISEELQALLPPPAEAEALTNDDIDSLLDTVLSASEEPELADLLDSSLPPATDDEDDLNWLNLSAEGQPMVDVPADDLAGLTNSLDSLSVSNAGPEQSSPPLASEPSVGRSELNSLADLFEGEISNIESPWEDISDSEAAIVEPDSPDLDLSEAFSDLLDNRTEAGRATNPQNDLADFFGGVELEAGEAFTEPGLAPDTEIDLSADEDFADLFDLSADSSGTQGTPTDAGPSIDSSQDLDDLLNSLPASDDDAELFVPEAVIEEGEIEPEPGTLDDFDSLFTSSSESLNQDIDTAESTTAATSGMDQSNEGDAIEDIHTQSTSEALTHRPSDFQFEDIADPWTIDALDEDAADEDAALEALDELWEESQDDQDDNAADPFAIDFESGTAPNVGISNRTSDETLADIAFSSENMEDTGDLSILFDTPLDTNAPDSAANDAEADLTFEDLLASGADEALELDNDDDNDGTLDLDPLELDDDGTLELNALELDNEFDELLAGEVPAPEAAASASTPSSDLDHPPAGVDISDLEEILGGVDDGPSPSIPTSGHSFAHDETSTNSSPETANRFGEEEEGPISLGAGDVAGEPNQSLASDTDDFELTFVDSQDKTAPDLSVLEDEVDAFLNEGITEDIPELPSQDPDEFFGAEPQASINQPEETSSLDLDFALDLDSTPDTLEESRQEATSLFDQFSDEDSVDTPPSPQPTAPSATDNDFSTFFEATSELPSPSSTELASDQSSDMDATDVSFDADEASLDDLLLDMDDTEADDLFADDILDSETEELFHNTLPEPVSDSSPSPEASSDSQTSSSFLPGELMGRIDAGTVDSTLTPSPEEPGRVVSRNDSDFDEIDSLLEGASSHGGEAATIDGSDFNELDLLLDDDSTTSQEPKLSDDDTFDELNLLLNDGVAVGTDSEAETSNQDSGNQASLDELDMLLEGEPSQGEAEGEYSSDAHFNTVSVPPNTPSVPVIEVVPPNNNDAEDDFSDLEKLLEEADQTLGGSSPTIRSTSGNRPSRRIGSMADHTMRVSVRHLDTLNNLVGELVVNRNSLEQDQERLRQFLDNLLFQVQQLNDVGQRMRDLYERSLLESSLISNRQVLHAPKTGGSSSREQTDNGDGDHATGATFDALEMDRFTGFHTLSQEMIELIVRVRESASDIGYTVESADQITRQLRQVTTQLQEGLNKARMVPFAQTADRLPRAVRDISLQCGKEARLVVEGRDTLIDKMILERLYDPMTHLVNNAITHGIETPQERAAIGKHRQGTITVRAFYQGNQTVIYIADDGAGINHDVVKQKAIKKGLITQSDAHSMTMIETYELLFRPGFSTRDKADDFAGRGVGLDVVRTALSEIRGSITIDSEMGRGTSFTIRLPLTLSISKALSCLNNQARIAFPIDGVEDMFDVPRDRIQTDANNQSSIQWRDTTLTFQPLSELLQFNRSLGRGRVYGGSHDDDMVSIVVLRSANTCIGLQVDRVLGEQEIVIKQLEGPVPKPMGIAGATVLGDGRVMPIADVLELIDIAQGRIRRDASSSLWTHTEDFPPEKPVETKAELTVLIVDDSITVRELLSMSFNKVGFRVEQARDGQEAWEKLRSGLPCNLVFCDIEMPRMDGLELLSRMQKDSILKRIPIAMLTSRGADRHRQMALDLGASGYFTKPYLEEALLDAAQRMLNGEALFD